MASAGKSEQSPAVKPMVRKLLAPFGAFRQLLYSRQHGGSENK